MSDRTRLGVPREQMECVSNVRLADLMASDLRTLNSLAVSWVKE